ncbi:MAG: HD-GYP domain-containing protein [Pseudothermotoga sp.]
MKKQLLLHPIILIVAFSLSMLFFANLNRQKASQVEKFALRLFGMHLQYTAKGLSEGYFHWDDMFSAILRNDKEFLNQQIEKMKELYPSLVKVDLIDGNIEKEFEIGYEQGFVKILFGIYDDEGQLKIRDRLICVLLDSYSILAEVGLKDVVNISKNGTFKFVYSGKVLTFYNFIISTIIGLIVVMLFENLRRIVIRQHYEHDGLEAIMEILSKKDSYTAAHSKMVASMALELGRALKLPKKDLKLLHTAGTLHDIGKIAVPESVLNKNEKLSAQEYEIVKNHPEIGAQIVERFLPLRETAKIIRYHHERLDGSGYPDGLKGEQIPLLSQVLAVADVYCALTDDRPYRKAYTKLEALQIMKTMPLNQDLVSLLERQLLMVGYQAVTKCAPSKE